MLTAYRPFKRRPALDSSDVVTGFFNRLGNLGVLLISGALLLGGLAGAAVVHHYDKLSAQTVASQQHTDKGEPKQAKKNPYGKHKPAQRPHHQQTG
jgi:hypothetical protein